MSDNERGRRNNGWKGPFGTRRDIIFSAEDFDPQELQSMSKKGHFDDDLRNIPTIRSSITGIDGNLRIFIGKGDRVVIKIDKEMPDIEIAARNILLEPGTKALVINSGIGALGVVLAAMNQETNVFLYDSNVQDSQLSQRNLEANYEHTRNASVINGVPKRSVRTAIYDVASGYTALQTITDNVLLAKSSLKEGGNFYCITYTGAGAPRHEAIVKNIFGNVTTVAKGNGGYRVFEAVNKGDFSVGQQDREEETAEFSIFGRHFSLLTEPGVFSKGSLDPGTRLLLESVPVSNFNRLLDLGCGWGPIGIVAASTNSRGKAVLVDIDSQAVKVAQENIRRLDLENRVKAIATNDVRTVGGNFDLVLTNPPLHADTGSLVELFKRVKKVTNNNGKVYIVVEKTYIEKFKQILNEVFGRYEIVNQNSEYYILSTK